MTSVTHNNQFSIVFFFLKVPPPPCAVLLVYYILIFGFVLFEIPVDSLANLLEIRTWNRLSAAQNLIETLFMARLRNGTEAAWMGKSNTT